MGSIDQLTHNSQIANLQRRVGHLLGTIGLHKQVLMAIANQDIPRLRQTMRVALSKGVSMEHLIRILQDTSNGVYRARGNDQTDINLVALVHHIGGSKLLYAVAHATGLPSLQTLKRNRKLKVIRPSSGPIRPSDIAHNLASIFGEPTAPSNDQTLVSHSILFDEISLDERARYFRWNNEIGGLCREHTETADRKIHSVEAVERVAELLEKEVCHIGREATVMAIAAFSAEDYHAKPFILSPTCKTEKFPEQAQWLKMCLEQWKALYAGSHGPIWSVATDGDATQRAALHRILMIKTLDLDGPLYEVLGKLPGLNLECGDDDETADSDPKHIFKRLCALLRSVLGIIIGETILDKENLSKYLLRVPSLSRETVADLVNPEDPQDVPRAVALMQALIKLSKLPSTGLNPKEQKDTGALALLGVMLSSLLEPFVDINMSLTSQMTSLATYAFISFAIFKVHGTSFSSNQLYDDCQTMIKNAYFCVRKQQCMSPTSPFFLIQLGDDHLELHFCEVRCATHQCNVDISELSQKTAAAMDRHEIFERHRDWDRGHRRLKFVDSIAVDHINPRSWTGENIVGAVCLESTWLTGKATAEAALTAAQIPFNFNEFRQDGDSPLDMLRPNGNGIYPAVAPEKDRSI
ncbi:hypothetical protein FIBSPDRAFT_761107, partial [Athelia psychrophila]